MDKKEKTILKWPNGGSYSGPLVNFSLNKNEKSKIAELLGEKNVEKIQSLSMLFLIEEERLERLGSRADTNDNLDRLLMLGALSKAMEVLLKDNSLMFYFLEKAEDLYGSRFTRMLTTDLNSTHNSLKIFEQLKMIQMVCAVSSGQAKKKLNPDEYVSFKFRDDGLEFKYDIPQTPKKGGRKKGSKDWAMYSFINHLFPICEEVQGRPLTIINKNNQGDNLMAKVFKVLLPSLKLGAIPNKAINEIIKERETAFKKKITDEAQKNFSFQEAELENYVIKALETRRNGWKR
jgi:hypothetical protein